jgi:hypothetical protein
VGTTTFSLPPGQKRLASARELLIRKGATSDG